MIFEILLVVLFFVCVIGLSFLMTFLNSYFRSLGLKKAFDKKRRKEYY